MAPFVGKSGTKKIRAECITAAWWESDGMAYFVETTVDDVEVFDVVVY